MTFSLFLIVLATAFLHAAWNALIKHSGERTVVMLHFALAPALLSWPFLFFLPPLTLEAVPWLLLSTLLHAGYSFSFIVLYRIGDFGQVYPIARGCAPLFVAGGAWLLAKETPSLPALAAFMLITLGILIIGRPQADKPLALRTLALALFAGLLIGSYSVIDGLGARTAGNAFTYVIWLGIAQCLPIAILALTLHGKSLPWKLRATWKGGVAGGLVAWGGYALILWAMTKAPLAEVVAVREVSILFAVLLGVFFFKEGLGKSRLGAAGLIVAGLVLLRLVA